MFSQVLFAPHLNVIRWLKEQNNCVGFLMIKKMSYAKVLSFPSQPSEPWDIGALKYFMRNLDPLIETKILGGRKEKISGMIRYIVS